MWARAQNRLNAGELSPLLGERSDLDKYANGLSHLENWIVLPYGGIYRRPGTRFLVETKNSGKARLFRFDFSTEDSFQIEIGGQYARFIKGREQVKTGAGGVYEIATPWLDHELRQIQFVQLNDVLYLTHPKHAPRRLSRLADTNWTIAELFADDDEIRTGLVYPPFLSRNADETTVQVKTGEFPDWAASTAYVIGSKVNVEGLLYIATTAHTSSADFNDDLHRFSAGLPQTPLSYWRNVGYDSAGETYDSVTMTSSAPVWDDGVNAALIPAGSFMEVAFKRPSSIISVDFGTTSVDADGDGRNEYYSDILTGVFGAYTVRTYGIWNATLKLQRSYDAGQSWEILAMFDSQSDRNVDSEGRETRGNAWYRLEVEEWTASSPAGSYTARATLTVEDAEVAGVVKVESVASQTEATVKVLNILYGGDATEEWRSGAWNSNQGYPRALAVHELRLYFGGTEREAQRTWGSAIDNFEWFKPGGTEDSDSVSHLFASGNQNRIEWMVSQNKLLVGTSGAEWTFGSSRDDEPITPGNPVAKDHSAKGSKHIQAIAMDDVVMFVQRSGRKVREFRYSFEEDGHVSGDVTRLAEHITSGEILEWTYQRQRDQILWAVTGNGKLIGLTYERMDDVTGWHQHTTDGEFESVSSNYGTTENDELWLVVKRTIDGVEKRYIEYFDPETWNYEKTDAGKSGYVYVDSAVSFGVPVTFEGDSVIFNGDQVIWGAAGGSTIQAAHLVNKRVTVLADGAAHPDLYVSDAGTITLETSVNQGVAGLPFTSKVRPMRLVTPGPSGTSRGREKKAHELVFWFHQSLGGEISANASEQGGPISFKYDPLLFKGDATTFGADIPLTDAVKTRDTEDPLDASPPLFTGEYDMRLDGGWQKHATWELRTIQPFPMTLLSITTKFNIPSNP